MTIVDLRSVPGPGRMSLNYCVQVRTIVIRVRCARPPVSGAARASRLRRVSLSACACEATVLHCIIRTGGPTAAEVVLGCESGTGITAVQGRTLHVPVPPGRWVTRPEDVRGELVLVVGVGAR